MKQSQDFETDGIFHGFFTRQGGVSSGIYSSLNCGPGSDDDPTTVQENREIVRKIAGAEHLLSLYQVHGKDCVVVEQPWGSDRPQADAMVTDKPGIALGVLTADCGPVLFHGQKPDGAPVIGAAHAGWGGALRGVLGSTVEQMISLGAELNTIKACIGPCIAVASYEVQNAFANNFFAEDDENERFFKAAKRDGHLMFDLAGYCAFKLSKSGIRQVLIMDIDTYACSDEFFSYRRATHENAPDYGRQISVISIK